MRPIQETTSRWDATLTSRANISDLRAAVRDTGRSPCTNGLRSICWKAFLLFQNLDTSTWAKPLGGSRSAYISLKDHFKKNIENPDDLSAEDPLTDTETSPWNVLRQDEELRAEIFQDVERCMPENLYFREPSTQSMLLDILFIYCKLNKDIGYRQGMHEVLAPVLWVISRDAIDVKSEDACHTVLDDLILESLDKQYVEHDTFTLFGIIMQTVKTFYETGNNSEPATSGLLNNSPIVERSKRIHEIYLHHADPELSEHLTAIEILPQIFLIRWIRLLFGREFPFEDVLALWDVLFAEDPALDLIDLISVSMLLRIRWQLLEADYTAALTLLLRYPVPLPPHGPATFVADALYLRENLLLDGGDHIISKYSRKAPETTVTRKLPKKVRRARTAEQAAAQKEKLASLAPSPFGYIQQSGGLEGIVQEAAKGIYNRGEKWGVAKALRGAVQGLQPGNNSPQRLPDISRWSIDSGKKVTDSPVELFAKMQALEQRNKSLAKLLETAMEGLWIQFRDKKDETASDLISLAIAKVQFVQVYLENSTMPLPKNEEDAKGFDGSTDTSAVSLSSNVGTTTFPTGDGSNNEKAISTNSADMTTQRRDRSPASTPTKAAPFTPRIKSSSKLPTHTSFHQSRPGLAQSSFSWMLGEGEQKSSFVAASPFPSETRYGRIQSRSLFGDEKKEDKKGRKGSDAEDGEVEDEDVFKMGTLRGGRGR